MLVQISGIRFCVKRGQHGWFVQIFLPNGASVRIHDFQTEAGAKAWIRVNARNWAKKYADPR